MNKVVNRFRYTITDRIGPLLVEPLGESDFAITWQRNTDGQTDYKETMPSGIVFRGDAFHKLLKIESSFYRCEYADLLIERRCGGDNWAPWFSGRMSNNDGAWDLDGCKVTMKCDDIKPDQCIEDGKGTEFNLFGVSIGFRRQVLVSPTNIIIERVTYNQTVTGEIACHTLNPWLGAGTPYDGAWAEYREELTQTGSGVGKTCIMSASFAREKIDLPCGTPPPGPEWIVIVDGCPAGTTTWARRARLYGCTNTTPDYGSGILNSLYECQIVGDAPENISIDNGLPLERVLDLFLENLCIGYTVVSNFFQINPDIPSTINYVTGQRSKTRFITIYQKSDVKRATDSNNATIANMSFDNLLTALTNMFNLEYRIEGGNILRLEHVSYYTKNEGFDLTLDKWKKWVSGKRQYTYDTPTLPEKETFNFMESGPGDFTGVPITYSMCVTKGGRNNTINRPAENITTDVQLILGNPDPDSNIVSDNGFVFIAAEFDSVNNQYFIISEAGILGGNTINNSLAWAQLHRDYWKWNRPARNGLMNYIDTHFTTVQPTKRGAQLVIPLCCDDVFNPDEIITTPLGRATVDKAAYSFKSETLTLDLLYVADDNLVTNQAPIARDDVATTSINTSVLIDVLANDSDENGQLLTLKVVLPPLHGTAVVVGKKIRYTPATGYLGSDLFLYTVSDEWNQPSGNALVAIIVTPANAAPVALDNSYNVIKDTPLNITTPFAGVLGNDFDDVGFTLDSYDAATINSGTVAMNPDGTFVYTPLTGYVGDDSFTYTIIDAGLLTSTATVHLNVIDPDAPFANPDAYQAIKNTNLVVAAPGVLANDTTTIGSLTVQTPGTFPTFAGGSVTIASNGSFVYTPLANFVGVDTFTYFAYNGTAATPTTVTIRVFPLIYVKMQFINPQTQNAAISCANGSTDGGQIKTQTVRLLFYSNPGGSVPFDVSGLGLIINLRVAIQSSPGGVPSNVDGSYLVSGTQLDVFVNRQYFRNLKNCFGQTVYYTNESFSLLAGAYTII